MVLSKLNKYRFLTAEYFKYDQHNIGLFFRDNLQSS